MKHFLKTRIKKIIFTALSCLIGFILGILSFEYYFSDQTFVFIIDKGVIIGDKGENLYVSKFDGLQTSSDVFASIELRTGYIGIRDQLNQKRYGGVGKFKIRPISPGRYEFEFRAEDDKFSTASVKKIADAFVAIELERLSIFKNMLDKSNIKYVHLLPQIILQPVKLIPILNKAWKFGLIGTLAALLASSMLMLGWKIESNKEKDLQR